MLSRMKPWSIADTRRLVEARFGRAHLDRAAPSLNSLTERLHYARYHYQEIQRLLGSFTELHLATKPLLFVIHGGDEASREEFEVLMIEVGSHSTACVQSIHAISDIMAHAVYHGLGHSLDVSPLPDRDISAASVLNRLRHVPAHAAIAEVMSRMCRDSCYKNVAALANKSKHQSIVKPVLNEDFTGSRAQRHEFRFSAFQYGGMDFPEATLASVLDPAYELASRTIVDGRQYAQQRLGSESGLTWCRTRTCRKRRSLFRLSGGRGAGGLHFNLFEVFLCVLRVLCV